MASPSVVVQEMMDEFKKTSQVIRTRVEQVVGDITIDILSQNQGRFRRLRETKDFSIVTTSSSYKLPGDFNASTNQFYEIDTSGNPKREIEIVDEQRFFERKFNPDYSGSFYAYIQSLKTGSSGPGEFLTLNALPSETGTFRFHYYRRPTASDTDIIKNVLIVKEGVRSRFPEFYPLAQQSMVIYERMKSGVKEDPTTRSTGMTFMPSKKDRRHNRMMYNIGRGRSGLPYRGTGKTR